MLAIGFNCSSKMVKNKVGPGDFSPCVAEYILPPPSIPPKRRFLHNQSQFHLRTRFLLLFPSAQTLLSFPHIFMAENNNNNRRPHSSKILFPRLTGRGKKTTSLFPPQTFLPNNQSPFVRKRSRIHKVYRIKKI